VHMKELVFKLTKAGNKIRKEQGREPTIDDYVKTMHISTEKVKEILKITQTQNTIPLLTPMSLEDSVESIEDEENIKDSAQYEENIGDFIVDKTGPNPATSTAEFLRKQEVADVLAKLSEREAKIIKLRFGLDCGYPRTLEEVGKICNLSPQRISQIKHRAVRRLRHPRRVRLLKDYKNELDK